MKEFITKNKTTIAAILIALTTFLKARNLIDMDTSILITSMLGAFGLAAAKDHNTHSTSDQVKKADRENALNKTRHGRKI